MTHPHPPTPKILSNSKSSKLNFDIASICCKFLQYEFSFTISSNLFPKFNSFTISLICGFPPFKLDNRSSYKLNNDTNCLLKSFLYLLFSLSHFHFKYNFFKNAYGVTAIPGNGDSHDL